MPTDAQSFPLPLPSPGYHVSGKEVEVRDSGSRHHQLGGCCDLQLIQSHAAPSPGPPARVLSPLFFQEKSLLLPKPSGPSLSPQNFVVLSSFTSEPHGPLSIYLLQSLVVLPFTSEPRGLFFSPKTLWSSPLL